MYYKEKIEDILKELNVSEEGLSDKEAQDRLNSYGKNEIEDKQKESKLKLFFKQFQDTMIIMLLIVSVISFVYSSVVNESYVDTIIIVFIVILNAIMGYLQEAKAAASIESLKKTNNTLIRVRRNNKEIKCDSICLVPGDIIILEAGDKIPADCRILNSSSAKVDESILTGESEPVNKDNKPIEEEVLINDRVNMLYSGCSVINGHIEALVVATGMNTEIGKIAQSILSKKEIPTPLQKKITEISKNLSIIVIFIIGFVFIYNILFLHNNIVNVIMLCISLMVSAVPEGLPAVISVSLSLGVKEMSKKNALIRNLASVETLGAVEVICSDKTGTITKNEMTVTKIVNNCKCYDIDVLKECNNLLINNMILCNNSSIEDGNIIGDPTETALLEYAKDKVNINEIIKTYKRIIEIPFDSSRKMMSTINDCNKKQFLYTKGSLESILKSCKYYIENDEIKKLTTTKKEELIQIEKEMADQALRVLGFASREITLNEYSELKEEELLSLEKELVFTGMIGMIDPPRDGVKESIKMCKQAGIIPIIITGDSLNTALAISKKIDLIDSDEQGIEGKYLKDYSDSEMINLVRKYRVYARVSPEDKVRIVKAWQQNNKVVAMTGDGVNDAPAIKLAHVGIGMGQTGTEVTKSVADVLLLDDCFNTIVSAIKEGRRIYNNIRNVILYSLSSNFAEIFIVIAGMFLGLTVLLPIQILYIDLVTDAILAICLAFEHSGKNIMKVPPHPSTDKFFNSFIKNFLLISSIIEAAIIYLVYKVGLNNYGETIAQTMAFLCLMLQEMLFAINCRNLKEPIIKQGIFSNKYINIGFVSLVIIQIIIFVTPIKNLLHIVNLNISQYMIIFVVNIIAFIIIEILKPILNKLFKD